MYETASSASANLIHTRYRRVLMNTKSNTLGPATVQRRFRAAMPLGRVNSKQQTPARSQGATESRKKQRAQPEPDSSRRSGPDDSADDERALEKAESTLPLDQVFEILKNRRRREVLHYLEDQGGEASLSDLAEHIAAIENDTTVKAISSTQRKRVYVGLYQCHLPKMDDMDIVDFDQNRGTVVQSVNAEQVKAYLGEPEVRPWYKMYVSITLAGAALLVLAQLAGNPSIISPGVVLVGLITAILLASVYHALALRDSVPDAL